MGWSALFTTRTTQNNVTNTSTTQNTRSFPPLGNVGVKFGYTHFFKKWVGIRGYANYHYGYQHNSVVGNASQQSTLLSYHQVAGNVEATFRFFDFGMGVLGAYAGLGVGYATSNIQNKDITSVFVLPVNVGLEVYVGKHHNANLNFRIPTIATVGTETNTIVEGITNTAKIQEQNFIITLGYSYTF